MALTFRGREGDVLGTFTIPEDSIPFLTDGGVMTRGKQAVRRVAARYLARVAARRVAGDYYHWTPGMSVRDVASRWQGDGDKVYDDSHPVFPAKDLWPYREFTWTRDKARPGIARVKGKAVDLPGSLKWDAMVEDLKANGWDPKEPAYVAIGRKGGIKVGEGNHRLAIAQKLNLKVPVRFQFYTGKVTKDRQEEEPVRVNVPETAIEKALNPPKRLPKKVDRDVDRLMKLFRLSAQRIAARYKDK